MLHSFLLGVFITFFYDLFRVFRRVVRHGIFWISLEDLVFWVMASVGIFYLLYYENNGAFRWFAVFGAGAGMVLYKKTLSEPLVKWTAKGINRVFRLLGRLLWKLAAPIRFLLKKCRLWSGRAVRRCRREIRIWRRAINYRLTAWRKVFKIKVYQFRSKLKKAKEN